MEEDIYDINFENQNQFNILEEEFGNKVSSFFNQSMYYHYSNSEYKKYYNFDNDLERLSNDENSLTINNSTSNTEKIKFEKVKTKKNKIEVFVIEKLPKEKKSLKQKRNRTKNNKNNNGEKKHTKYAFDNIASKIRTNLFKGILVVLNKSLEDQDSAREEKCYTSKSSGKIETKMRDKSFYKINIDEYGKTVKGNLDLLKMPLRQIFYQDCSEKYKNYQNNNKNLLNEISGNSAFNKTNQILDMTVLQCLEHFRGTQRYDVLDGLEIEYQRLIKKFRDDQEEKDYIEQFKEGLNTFEKNFQGKKSYKK